MANPAADTDADGLPDAWETTHGLAPGSSADDDGALGDPDSDGLANLLEYATGLDPHARDASPLSLALAPHPTTGDRHLVVTYRRLVAPGSLAIGLTVSENLRDWAAPVIAPDQLSVVPHPDGLTETVTVRAADAGGNLLDASAPITLSALIPQPLPPTGSHQTNDYFPFRGSAAVVRQQIHYPASALGATPRRLTGVALNITSPAPGASFAQWTIRLKATPRTTFADPSFDNSGWATVHSSTAIPSTTGWITFPFDAPFAYDGTGSLLVELSFRNPSTGSASAYISAAYESYYGRALRASSTTSVDPLTLTTGTYLSYVPVLRFLDQHSIPLRAPAAALVNGVWSGSVSLAAPAEFASLLASSANPAATGESNGFGVSAAPELAPSLPFTETWESGLVSPCWTLTGTLGYRTQIATLYAPHGGTRHLVLDTTPYAYDYSRNEATLTLDLAGRTGVALSFWAKRFYYEYAHAPASDPFTGGADFDGVAISADGLTWHEIQPLRDPDLGTDWKQFTVDLDAALAARGLAYTSTFRIRFNRYGDHTAASGGIALDDISVTAAPVPTPTLTLPASVAESAAPFSGTLSLSAARPTSTTFTLASSAPAKLALPATLTLPAGRSSVSFTATPIDDSLFDGTRLIAVTATPPAGSGLHPGVTTLTLADDDSPALTLSVAPSSLPENNYGTATATLRLGAPPAAPITVALASGDPTAATVPASLAFAPGQTTATFPVTVVNDTLIDGTQTTTLSATLPGATPATATFTVTDDETATLALSSFTSVFEGADRGGLITLGGTLPADLVVTLVSSDPARLTVPATVTIPAGDTSASFILDAPDDTSTNGGASVTVTASAPDLSSATRSISVIDDDLHHFVFADIPSPQATRVPLTVTITAFNIDGIQLTNHTGSVTLSAAGANGPVDLTPATASPFVRGIWSGPLTFTQADTAVRITAAAPTASGLSNAFDVSFSPAIAITPERLDLTLHVGSSDTRTLTLANTGGGTLAWSLRVAADVAPTAGQAASDVAPTADRGIAQESDHGSGLQEGPNALSAAPPPMLLENVLASLNRDHALIRDAIPDRYAFSEGVTGNYIHDGGGNMYDYGNVLSTNLAPYSYSSLPYSNDAIRAATDLLGAGGRYFTRKFDGLFVFAADIDGLSHFEITGGLGAYGAGYTDTATLTRTHSGVTYKGFVKRVFGTTTPSVNHLVIVADNDSVTHTAATNTNSDQHRVSGLSGTTRIYYLLYAGTSGAYIDDTATQAIFSAFLDAVGTPDFLSVSATSGQITAGATEPLTLSFDAADLAPGLHQRNLVFTSNDPARPTVTIPVALTVQDRVLHHFEFDPLPASLVRGAPASIRLRAVDADGFRVYNFNAPVTLSATGTTLAEPVTATGWVGGIWTGQITPATFAAAATLSASDGSGITGLSNAFAVTTGPLAQLLWDPVASPRTVDTPFPVTVRAADAGGNLLNNVSAPLALSALVPQPLPPTGSQDTTSYYPFYNQAAVVRQQIIYPASTLGAAPRLLSGLAMNIIATNPAASFAQWTIRLKNTTRTTFAGTAFDNSGWTTVHSSTATPFTTGWITFPFDAPFAYDGTGSLLVELSFRNPSQTTTWVAISASRDWSYARSRRTYSTTPLDPLTLTNGNDSDQVPVLQFLDRQLIPLRAPAASLSNGVWSGSVSLSAPAAFASLRATSAIPAATGDSRPFTVSAAPIPPPAFPFTETWESSLLSPRWTLTGTSSYRTQITTDHGPHGGTRHLVLDTLPGTYTNSRNEATLTLDLAGRTGVTLSFWAKRFNYEYAHAPASNPFTGGADFDGVAISADGVTWHEVHPLRAPDLTTDWKQFTVDLDAALAARGLAHTSTFRIRFNRYDYYAAPDGGIALDDITVTAAPVVAPPRTHPPSAPPAPAPHTRPHSPPPPRPPPPRRRPDPDPPRVRHRVRRAPLRHTFAARLAPRRHRLHPRLLRPGQTRPAPHPHPPRRPDIRRLHRHPHRRHPARRLPPHRRHRHPARRLRAPPRRHHAHPRRRRLARPHPVRRPLQPRGKQLLLRHRHAHARRPAGRPDLRRPRLQRSHRRHRPRHHRIRPRPDHHHLRRHPGGRRQDRRPPDHHPVRHPPRRLPGHRHPHRHRRRKHRPRPLHPLLAHRRHPGFRLRAHLRHPPRPLGRHAELGQPGAAQRARVRHHPRRRNIRHLRGHPRGRYRHRRRSLRHRHRHRRRLHVLLDLRLRQRPPPLRFGLHRQRPDRPSPLRDHRLRPHHRRHHHSRVQQHRPPRRANHRVLPARHACVAHLHQRHRLGPSRRRSHRHRRHPAPG